MVLSRKEIMLLANKEKAFQEISMHTDWSNHRKAAERSSWKKKHEPDKVVKCPNRGRRYKKKPEQHQVVKQEETNKTMILVKEEEEFLPCYNCKKSSDGYDFPCGHPICYPCFQKLFLEKDGNMTCQVCKQQHIFRDDLVDDDD